MPHRTAGTAGSPHRRLFSLTFETPMVGRADQTWGRGQLESSARAYVVQQPSDVDAVLGLPWGPAARHLPGACPRATCQDRSEACYVGSLAVRQGDNEARHASQLQPAQTVIHPPSETGNSKNDTAYGTVESDREGIGDTIRIALRNGHRPGSALVESLDAVGGQAASAVRLGKDDEVALADLLRWGLTGYQERACRAGRLHAVTFRVDEPVSGELQTEDTQNEEGETPDRG